MIAKVNSTELEVKRELIDLRNCLWLFSKVSNKCHKLYLPMLKGSLGPTFLAFRILFVFGYHRYKITGTMTKHV